MVLSIRLRLEAVNERIYSRGDRKLKRKIEKIERKLNLSRMKTPLFPASKNTRRERK
jgi:hypothetical protein